MEKTKLIRLFKVMSEQEFKRFQFFVQSPLYNTNKRHTQLLDFIAQFHPSFDAPPFTEENAFAAVYPDKTFKSGSVTKTLSKLFILLTDFLATETTLNNSFNKDLNLLREYSNRNLENDFERLSKKILAQEKKKKEGITNDNYYNRFLLEKEINLVLSTQKDKSTGDAHFIDTGKALDIYYFYTKLVNTCQVINRSHIMKGLDIDPFNIKIVEMIPKMEYIDEPIIKIWYSAYLMLSQEDKLEHYNVFKENLFSNSNIPIKAELRVLFTYLENIAIQVTRPQSTLFEELYQIYNFQLEKDILLHDEVLIPGIMRNYMIVAINLNKLTEADHFLRIIKERASSTYPDIYKYCTAMLSFSNKNYEETLNTLNDINFNDLIMRASERVLRLKTYYHLGYMDLLDDNLNNFRVFLTYNKKVFSDYLLDANRRFSNYLTKIIKIQGNITTDFTELREVIEADQKTFEKKWLLAQIQD